MATTQQQRQRIAETEKRAEQIRRVRLWEDLMRTYPGDRVTSPTPLEPELKHLLADTTDSNHKARVYSL